MPIYSRQQEADFNLDPTRYASELNNIKFEKTASIATRFEYEVIINKIYIDNNIPKYAYKMEGKFDYFDLRIKHPTSIGFNDIEVKAQTEYNDDSFGIETKQGGKPSGIMTSTADFYYIFKYKYSQSQLLQDIFYYEDVAPSQQDNITYDLYKIKKDDLLNLINIPNNNFRKNTYNDLVKGDNETVYIPINRVPFEKFNNSLEYSSYQRLINDNLFKYDRNITANILQQKNIPKPANVYSYDNFVRLYLSQTYFSTKKQYYLDNPDIIINDLIQSKNSPKPPIFFTGFGHSDSDSSSSSSDEGTCRKVFNRLKRNINKKYKIKKEKYL
jgi:hypothetical protein